MVSINDNDLKNSGVFAIEAALANDAIAVISDGETTFVVMTIEEYQRLRESDLEVALAQTKADLAEGRFTVSFPEQHLEKMKQ